MILMTDKTDKTEKHDGSKLCPPRSKRTPSGIYHVNKHFCNDVCLYQNPDDYSWCHPMSYRNMKADK